MTNSAFPVNVDESEAPVCTRTRVPVGIWATHDKMPPYPKDFLLHIVNDRVDELEIYDAGGDDGISPEFRLDGMGLQFTFE